MGETGEYVVENPVDFAPKKDSQIFSLWISVAIFGEEKLKINSMGFISFTPQSHIGSPEYQL